MTLTLPQIEGKIREFTAIMYAPEEFIPTLGSSNQTGLPHIEIHGGQYMLMVCENGAELSREAFDNVDALILKVLEDISFSMACDQVFQDTSDHGYRERFVSIQKNILSRINRYHNEKVKNKQETLSTDDNSALSESRKNMLLKSNRNEKSLKKL